MCKIGCSMLLGFQTMAGKLWDANVQVPIIYKNFTAINLYDEMKYKLKGCTRTELIK